MTAVKLSMMSKRMLENTCSKCFRVLEEGKVSIFPGVPALVPDDHMIKKLVKLQFGLSSCSDNEFKLILFSVVNQQPCLLDISFEDRKSSNNRMRPIPKFGEWKEGDPSSAEGFSAIFEERRKEKLNGHACSGRITLSEPKKKKRSSFKLKRFIKALKKKFSMQRKWFGCWFPFSS